MTGSAVAAQKHLEDLQNFAAKPPFEFSELVQESQKLQGVGVEARNVIPLLKDVENALAASGRIDSLPFATKALGDIQAKGRLQAQEVIQLANAGIPALQILSKKLNITTAEVIKLGKNGAISSDLFFESLHRFSQEKFGDAMVAQSRTAAGAFSNVKDVILQTSSTAFEPFYKKISSLAVDFGDKLLDNKDDFEGIGKTIAEYVGKGIGSVTSEIAVDFGKLLAHEITTSGKDSFIDNLGHGFATEFFPDLTAAIGLITENEAKNFKAKSNADFANTGTVKTIDDIIADIDKRNAKNLTESKNSADDFKSSIIDVTGATDELNTSISETEKTVNKVPLMSDKLGVKQATKDVQELSSFIKNLFN